LTKLIEGVWKSLGVTLAVATPDIDENNNSAPAAVASTRL
jgi:hypothetical protein